MTHTNRIRKIKFLVHYPTAKSQSKNHFEIINLQGKALLPAFTDCHTHFTDYAKQFIQLDLSGCRSINEVKQRLENYRETHPKLTEWV